MMSESVSLNINTAILQIITADQAWYYRVIPKNFNEKEIIFYTDSKENSVNYNPELEMIFGKPISFDIIDSDILLQTLGKYYRKAVKQNTRQKAKVNINSDAFLFEMISEANSIGSSDIHLEAYEDIRRIRMRIDGKLVERYIIDLLDYPALVNKIKIKANLDIAEKRLPQDGRIFFSDEDHKFDIRVSVLPTLHGEKIVMRLLSKDAGNIDIHNLGFDEKQLADYLEGIRKPHGIILISGPTGSGKTTSLYATLKILNKETVNISTIEDPIEYTLDGINQTQLREGIGLTFASALRTFLRQDPDIIMLGEIRDAETAEMAIRAALTGHLVLSTIHTNSAWETISRLTDMGIAPYLLAGTLNLTVAQRLVRVLCPNCKKEQTIEPSEFPSRFFPPKPITKQFKPVGCETCFYTGYKGRKAVYEIIPIDSELTEFIKNESYHIKDILNKKNIKSLSDSAFELLDKGETSLEEIYPILLSTT